MKVPACRACVRRANIGTLMPPHERVRRTPDTDLQFGFYSKTWSKPQGADQKPSVLPPDRCRDTSPSKSTPVLGSTQHASSLPTTSKLCQQEEEEEDINDPFLESCERMKRVTGEKSHSNRGSDHAEVYPIRLQPRSIVAQADTHLYSMLPSKTRPSIDPQISADMSSTERAVLNCLTELGKMAEDTSATARRNGIYCEQHWQKELQMEIDACHSQVHRTTVTSQF
ncbi:unnamed protein product [Peronospora destructor]|uniref:Uncharacterized protein n=1 Tax=Peronospora destructor TaxID=86335 RepID=A0AAV0V7Z7_9STRA|nr:unnamed protein product [Peronospora destructor]